MVKLTERREITPYRWTHPEAQPDPDSVLVTLSGASVGDRVTVPTPLFQHFYALCVVGGYLGTRPPQEGTLTAVVLLLVKHLTSLAFAGAFDKIARAKPASKSNLAFMAISPKVPVRQRQPAN